VEVFDWTLPSCLYQPSSASGSGSGRLGGRRGARCGSGNNMKRARIDDDFEVWDLKGTASNHFKVKAQKLRRLSRFLII
jgi:hypothetical protein